MEKLKSVSEFEKYKEGHTVFLFTAEWCSDCRYLEPFLPEIEQEFPNYKFVIVERDQFLEICMDNSIYGIPSFIVYRQNHVLGTFISKFRKTKQEVIRFIHSVTDTNV